MKTVVLKVDAVIVTVSGFGLRSHVHTWYFSKYIVEVVVVVMMSKYCIDILTVFVEQQQLSLWVSFLKLIHANVCCVCSVAHEEQT